MNFPEVEQKVNRLVHNISEQNRSYYDVFLNQTPKTVSLEHYDDDGVLKDVTIPNVAKVRDDIGYINTAMTLNVGPTRQYKSIQQAWNYLTDKRIEARVEIKVDDGEYETSRIDFNDHPNGEHIDIIGNISEPEKCVIRFVPDSKGYSHGIIIVNVKRLVLSGFKIVGSKGETADGEKSTHRGIRLDHHSSVYSHSNSIIIEGCETGVQAARFSHYSASKLRITNCVNGVFIYDLAIGHFYKAKISGNGKGTGTGIICGSKSYVYSPLVSVIDFSRGVDSTGGSCVKCDGAKVENCLIGYYSKHCSYLRNDRLRDTEGLPTSLHSTAPYVNGSAINCDIGFEANYGGQILANYSRTENCKTGFYTDENSILHVNESFATNCSDWGYKAENMSLIEAYGTQKNLSGNGADYTMEHGVLGNYNAMIRRS